MSFVIFDDIAFRAEDVIQVRRNSFGVIEIEAAAGRVYRVKKPIELVVAMINAALPGRAEASNEQT